MPQNIRPLSIDTWKPTVAPDGGIELAQTLESGGIVYLPRLTFRLEPGEPKFLDPRWLNGKSKNLSLEREGAAIQGATGSAVELDALGKMVGRFRANAIQLVQSLFPQYAAGLRPGRTSYRPAQVEYRKTSWRKDDSRLHVDAFPSRPTQGERILRLFVNIHPDGSPRVWRVGEPFEDLCQRMLPRLSRPWPGSAWGMAVLGITKSRRTEYDHLMLGLHDEMKRDTDYQRDCPQVRFDFPPGSTWICFSDQTSHAAMSGQYMLEQTFHLPMSSMYLPELSPLRVLERLTGRKLT
jgi:3-deoxy-D-manno-oct-2-ulosonic acid (Kdo) hydroxylase